MSRDKVVPPEISVKTGNGVYPVRLEEAANPVTSEWLSLTLGLKSGLKNRANQDSGNGECCRASGEGKWELVGRCQGKSDRVGENHSDQGKSREKAEKRGDRCQKSSLLRKDLVSRKTFVEVRTQPKIGGQEVACNGGVTEKGKERWVQKLNLKPARLLNPKGGIIIGVERMDQFSQNSDDNSSSGEDLVKRGVFRKGFGESSYFNGPGPTTEGVNKKELLRKDYNLSGPLIKVGCQSPSDVVVKETQMVDAGGSRIGGSRNGREKGSKANSRTQLLKTRRTKLKFSAGVKS
ncbi:hypothetical protein LWI29_005582 [Acer saccharum]|uniref:Uncharacterized protein n=1 Tax=Acer saccharum TaxID=4024 RepID=A0AA39SNW6_ACESA|nr:hypothetical protein LWI29_005582 [Acer saccharum]